MGGRSRSSSVGTWKAKVSTPRGSSQGVEDVDDFTAAGSSDAGDDGEDTPENGAFFELHLHVHELRADIGDAGFIRLFRSGARGWLWPSASRSRRRARELSEPGAWARRRRRRIVTKRRGRLSDSARPWAWASSAVAAGRGGRPQNREAEGGGDLGGGLGAERLLSECGSRRRAPDRPRRRRTVFELLLRICHTAVATEGGRSRRVAMRMTCAERWIDLSAGSRRRVQARGRRRFGQLRRCWAAMRWSIERGRRLFCGRSGAEHRRVFEGARLLEIRLRRGEEVEVGAQAAGGGAGAEVVGFEFGRSEDFGEVGVLLLFKQCEFFQSFLLRAADKGLGTEFIVISLN